ncbi:unnamed protein product [Parascedosporium putredinis]|uniref:Uncharacterized protein n=1 Tax=Parascedosporium putredinis TaxID=1442378 RepID=A0A9P1HCT0_9PEZI|nr:unnamed protein product [Parascedosporium putredinis]CAI8005156.1 unnamed protein product [Parascedosporium putredinis]
MSTKSMAKTKVPEALGGTYALSCKDSSHAEMGSVGILSRSSAEGRIDTLPCSSEGSVRILYCFDRHSFTSQVLSIAFRCAFGARTSTFGRHVGSSGANTFSLRRHRAVVSDSVYGCSYVIHDIGGSATDGGGAWLGPTRGIFSAHLK